MVSEEKLVRRLREFLSTSDLNTTTNASVRRQLEKDFGIDLSDRKSFIREQIDIYLEQAPTQNAEKPEAEQPAEKIKSECDGCEEKEGEKESSTAAANEADEEEESEEVEEGEGDEEVKNSSKKKRKQSKEVSKRGNGFTKPCNLSSQLQEFIGESQMARTQVVKHMWNHIRENNLQNPSNKRIINCDDRLRELFKVDSIDMFQMNKALSKHIWPLDSDGASVSASATPKKKKPKPESDEASLSASSAPKKKKPKLESDEASVSASSRPKQKKCKPKSDEDSDEPKGGEKRKSGILAPLRLSDALTEFLGTGESELSRPSVVKRIWDYIKQNNLQDPSDKRKIVCDDKLKELFKVDTFIGFSVSKLLKDHFTKV
ncbi:unnamed protein product [Cuscuta epithymum]|uniref:Uncharacterized protein n=1 Tax=Cuscuta epithymum TaxID=186058 RepID=A0AAV0C2G6_9ASTE|nr:unnamed protein product [Cuscuta epithymum]